MKPPRMQPTRLNQGREKIWNWGRALEQIHQEEAGRWPDAQPPFRVNLLRASSDLGEMQGGCFLSQTFEKAIFSCF